MEYHRIVFVLYYFLNMLKFKLNSLANFEDFSIVYYNYIRIFCLRVIYFYHQKETFFLNINQILYLDFKMKKENLFANTSV